MIAPKIKPGIRFSLFTFFILILLSTILLLHSKAGDSKETSIQSCSTLEKIKKIQCWENIVDQTLREKGPESAFSTIETLYKSDSEFIPECHSFVHIIGGKAYELFKSGVSFNLPAETTFCGYGFFHGFTETLASEKGTAKQARDFCALVEHQLGGKLEDIANQCYHGFGHGSVDIHNETAWGDERKMLTPAIKLCSELADTPDKLFRCGTGAFDAISIAYYTHQYKLTLNKDNPFWLCEEQTNEQLKKACYVSIDPALMVSYNFDFIKAAKNIERIPQDDYATLAIASLASPVYWIENQAGKEAAQKADRFYTDKGLDSCRSLRPSLQLACISGVAFALTLDEGGKPQYREGLTFCRSSILKKDEQDSCLRSVWRTIRVMYPADKVRQICHTEGDTFDKQICST